MLLGVDVGGTFTDAVLAFDGRIVTAKAPTTPEDQSEGVIEAVRVALQRAGREAPDIAGFSHGMTVATNALLEGRGARTAFVATEGFADIVALGRQNRAELYRLCASRPAPFAPEELRFGAPERMTPDGPLRELGADQARELARRIADAGAGGIEAVAVALLHAYRHPEHELMIGEAIAEALPDVHVSLSHQVVGTFREFERAGTTEVDAALSPLLAGYLRRLIERCEAERLPRPAIMQSNGGLIDLESAAGHAAWTVLSGPAAGAAGAAFVARAAGTPDALCFDMGAPRATSAWSTAARSRSRARARSPAGRWRCRWSLCTPSGRAAARSAGAILAARCASARARPAPTPARRATGAAAPSRR